MSGPIPSIEEPKPKLPQGRYIPVEAARINFNSGNLELPGEWKWTTYSRDQNDVTVVFALNGEYTGEVENYLQNGTTLWDVTIQKDKESKLVTRNTHESFGDAMRSVREHIQTYC